MSDWNSEQYMKFEKERTRPSEDLLSRVDISPVTVLDIGCGPGNSTKKLENRFPEAAVLGIDNSDDMLARAGEAHPELEFKKVAVPGGLSGLGRFDLIFSNACLHWIPEHEVLLPAIMEHLNSGGVFAVQMPMTGEALFYKLLGALVSEKKWKKLKSIKNFHALSPEETYDILIKCSESVTMWETVYYHIVPSHRAVIEWYKGSGLRPYLEALSEDEKEPFINELLTTVEKNFPVRGDGNVILKMPRLFFTAKK